MNGSPGAKERYLTEYDQLEQALPGAGVPWLREARRRGLSCFAESGFPTPRQEDWKYTDVGPIAKRHFSFDPAAPGDVNPAQLQPFVFQGLDTHTLVFVNGCFAPSLSRLEGLPAGVTLSSLAEALARSPRELEAYLTRIADSGASGFTALNTAFMNDGAYLHVSRGVSVGQPVHVLYLVSSDGEIVTHPRNLIVADEHSRVTVIENYIGLNATPYFTNAITEVAAGTGAAVEHYKLQQESQKSYHVATIQAWQERDSRFVSRNVSLGGRLVRNDINTLFGAPGGDCVLEGLFMASGRQHVDNHTFVDHAVPHCSSNEYYKGVLADRARGVFNGRVMVRQDAQQSDAQQANHNLLLSEGAEMDTKPQLEIYADDVSCTHGATVGHLEDDALFYLRSRGVDEQSARSLLTYAFAREIVERIDLDPVRLGIESSLLERMPTGARLGRDVLEY